MVASLLKLPELTLPIPLLAIAAPSMPINCYFWINLTSYVVCSPHCIVALLLLFSSGWIAASWLVSLYHLQLLVWWSSRNCLHCCFLFCHHHHQLIANFSIHFIFSCCGHYVLFPPLLLLHLLQLIISFGILPWQNLHKCDDAQHWTAWHPWHLYTHLICIYNGGSWRWQLQSISVIESAPYKYPHTLPLIFG